MIANISSHLPPFITFHVLRSLFYSIGSTWLLRVFFVVGSPRPFFLPCRPSCTAFNPFSVPSARWTYKAQAVLIVILLQCFSPHPERTNAHSSPHRSRRLFCAPCESRAFSSFCSSVLLFSCFEVWMFPLRRARLLPRIFSSDCLGRFFLQFRLFPQKLS